MASTVRKRRTPSVRKHQERVDPLNVGSMFRVHRGEPVFARSKNTAESKVDTIYSHDAPLDFSGAVVGGHQWAQVHEFFDHLDLITVNSRWGSCRDPS